MAETTDENRICQVCGADVRPNTLFCYNCGKSVAPAIVQDLPNKNNISDGWLRETIVEKHAAGQTEAAGVRETIAEPLTNQAAAEETKLKSAAAMRRQSKKIQPKQVEVIWEERANAPNGWFIAAALLLTLFAFGIFYLATLYK